MTERYNFSTPKIERIKEELSEPLNPVERISEADTIVIGGDREARFFLVVDKLNEVIAMVNLLASLHKKYPAQTTRAVSAQAENVAPIPSTDNSKEA